jgi:Xaa-Pro dipeptidase
VVAVDRLGTPGFLALQAEGFAIRDSAPLTQEAREVKTPEEVELFDANAPMVMNMLSAVERSIAPGVRERELLAVLADSMLRDGGEYLATNTVCSGPNTNPWRAEATARRLEPGDLVFVDTDAVGLEGCFYCVSRTFPCGESVPTRAQRETYRAAHDWVRTMTELVRPGITCGELAAEAPKIPERYQAQRYECMIHGAGLEEESPSVCHPQDSQSNAERVIRENMVLVVEAYLGEAGAGHGVKLGDEVLVTPSGPRVLAPYPYSNPLLS